MLCCVFFFKQKTAYEMRISDWSSDVCSSDLKKIPDGRAGVRGVRSPRPVTWRDERRATIMDFISILSIFVLACCVGYYVVWSVTPALHTPLMAVTNAISSVILVGALIAGAEIGRASCRASVGKYV